VTSAQQPDGQADQPSATQAGPSATQAGRPGDTQAGPSAATQAGPSGATQVGPSGAQAKAAGTATPWAGKPDVYRSPVALVVWWLWVAFALANLIDLAVQGRDHFAAEVAAVLILVTGVAYVAAFRPRVLADDVGITIRNPLRDHHVPWDCVRSLDLRDSLEVHCTRQDGDRKDKTLYAWAVQSTRRRRLKAEARARRSAAKSASQQPPSYARLPAEAQAAMTKTDAENITAALRDRAARVQAAGAPGAAGARRTARWDLPAIAALVLPALLLIVVSLV
jgi:hypothetical protein